MESKYAHSVCLRCLIYACAVYMVNYISKAQKGMSELLQQACTEAKEENSSLKQHVRDIGSKVF